MVLKRNFSLLLIVLFLMSVIPISYFSSEKSEIPTKELIQEEVVKKDNYLAILEIPKINLKKELYNITDKKNDVNKNIYVHSSSVFPSNIILAGHSGNTKYSYFNNLNKLKVGDSVKIYYDHKIYEYKIKTIEEQNKTGTLYLKEENQDRIILITCHKKHHTQMIYYGYLENIREF